MKGMKGRAFMVDVVFGLTHGPALDVVNKRRLSLY